MEFHVEEVTLYHNKMIDDEMFDLFILLHWSLIKFLNIWKNLIELLNVSVMQKPIICYTTWLDSRTYCLLRQVSIETGL